MRKILGGLAAVVALGLSSVAALAAGGETISTWFYNSNQNPVLIEGSDGTNAVPVKVASDGTLYVTFTSSTTGGDSVFSAPGGTGTAAITNTAGGILVATGARTLKTVAFVNNGNALCYVQFFDLAAGTATLGTTVPKMFVSVPTSGTYGAWEQNFGVGVAFTLGIVVAATTTSTGSSACNAAQLATVTYK